MTFGRRITESAERRASEREERFAQRCTPSRAITPGQYAGTTQADAKPEPMVQHQGYMAAVRDLGYCMRCRRSCRPQFCHRDQGKGIGLKTDCREGWPGCAECHWIVGTSGQLDRDERRALELELGRRTREAVKAAGTWPARLGMWKPIGETA
jgi:hypothetical protein